ncbi:MAG TPA: hypothetical protein VHT91_49445 [Kofleriaceae bacterium]|jgi:hypothetical protein|nr:hypothetical protein [Kofleriaceae bacterium]
MVAASCACSRETSAGGAAAPPGEPSGAASSGDPSPASAAGPKRCAPWVDAASLVATSQGGRRDFVRKFEYNLASGVVRVHDSDPFATGSETQQPRVIDDTTTLSGASKDRLERALFVVCPSAAAMARRCGTGGCQRLTVTDRAGHTTRVEDEDTVAAIFREFVPLFPKLRPQ